MIISISTNTKKEMELLGIEEYPFSSQTLKSAFKREIILNHPDTGGSEETACNVITAYNHLRNLTVDVTGSVRVDLEERDMFDFSVPCPLCNGTGLGGRFGSYYTNRCKNCISVSRRLYVLKDGRYSTCANRHCPAIKHPPKCIHCNGTGRVESKPFNPVVARGGIL